MAPRTRERISLWRATGVVRAPDASSMGAAPDRSALIWRIARIGSARARSSMRRPSSTASSSIHVIPTLSAVVGSATLVSPTMTCMRL